LSFPLKKKETQNCSKPDGKVLYRYGTLFKCFKISLICAPFSSRIHTTPVSNGHKKTTNQATHASNDRIQKNIPVLPLGAVSTYLYSIIDGEALDLNSSE